MYGRSIWGAFYICCNQTAASYANFRSIYIVPLTQNAYTHEKIPVTHGIRFDRYFQRCSRKSQ